MSFQDQIIGDSMSTQLSSQSSLTALSYQRATRVGASARAARRARGARAELGRSCSPSCVGAGSSGGSALQVGQALLARRGRIAAADGDRSRSRRSRRLAGIGTARAVTVHAALELGRRMAAEDARGRRPVRSPRDVCAAVRAAAGGSAGRGVSRRGAGLAAPARARRHGHARHSQLVARASARGVSRGDRRAGGGGHPGAQPPERRSDALAGRPDRDRAARRGGASCSTFRCTTT